MNCANAILWLKSASSERSLRRSLKHADRKGAALVVIIGEAERERGSAILRDMSSHQEWTVAIDHLPRRVEEAVESA